MSARCAKTDDKRHKEIVDVDSGARGYRLLDRIERRYWVSVALLIQLKKKRLKFNGKEADEVEHEKARRRKSTGETTYEIANAECLVQIVCGIRPSRLFGPVPQVPQQPDRMDSDCGGWPPKWGHTHRSA